MKNRGQGKIKGILAIGLFAVAGVLMFSFHHKIVEEDSVMQEETDEVLASFEKIDLTGEEVVEPTVVFELEILEKDEDVIYGSASAPMVGMGARVAMELAIDSYPKSQEEIWQELMYDIPGYRQGEEYLPDSLRQLYVINEEAREFVLNYSEKKGKHAKIDLRNEVTKGKIPALLQWDERWGYEKYGEGLMAVNACGPTTLSMVYMGLSGDTSLHPLAMAQLAEEKGFYVEGSGSSWNIMKDLARSIGLDSRSGICDAAHIEEQLRQGHPVVCIMGPGDFTLHGHFIVLTGLDEDGKVILNDSNSRKKSERTWDIDTIVKQTKNLWFFYGYSEQVKADYENRKNPKPVVDALHNLDMLETDQTTNASQDQESGITSDGQPSVSGGDVIY